MRVRGDVLPSGSFTLEEQPNKPGFCLVRFFENAEPFTETKDGLTVSGCHPPRRGADRNRFCKARFTLGPCHPHMGMWIEIGYSRWWRRRRRVTPHVGGVD